jgi:prepilin-type N-terminal cleavage/methylation domain-containing protein
MINHLAGVKTGNGFTLIELLVVIAIIAILAVVVVLTLNPAELLKQSRDSSRISDLSTLKSGVSLYLVDAVAPNIASSTPGGYNNCYVSTLSGNGATSTQCGVFKNTYSAVVSTTAALYKNNNSTGWLPVNFSQITYGSPLSALPTDPTNNASYYYAYAATTTGGYYFEINAFIESKKYNASGTSDAVGPDGGNNTSTLEVGNQPGLNL